MIAVIAYCFSDFENFVKHQPVGNRHHFQFIRSERDYLGCNITDMVLLAGFTSLTNNFNYIADIIKRCPDVKEHRCSINSEFKLEKEVKTMRCFHKSEGNPHDFCPDCPNPVIRHICEFRKKKQLKTPLTNLCMGPIPLGSHSSPTGCLCPGCNPPKQTGEKTVKEQIAALRKQLHFDDWKKIQYRYVRDFRGNIFDTYAIYKIPVKFDDFFIVQRVRLRHNDKPDTKRAKVILIGKVCKIYEQVVKTATEMSSMNNLKVLQKKELKALKLKIHNQNEKNIDLRDLFNQLKSYVSPEAHTEILYHIAKDKKLAYLEEIVWKRRRQQYKRNRKIEPDPEVEL